MNIILMTPQWLKTKGGPTLTISGMSNKLRALGHNVTILTSDEGIGAVQYQSSFIFREIDIIKKFIKIKPDVIHIHGRIHLVLPAILYKTINKCRIVFTFHTQPYIKDFIPELIKSKPEYRGLKKNIAKFLLNRCDKITAVSHSIIENLNKYYNFELNGASVIHTGNELPDIMEYEIFAFKRRYNIQSDYPILSSIGVFAYDWKIIGHKICIETIKILKSKYPKIKLLIAGDGEHMDYLLNIVKINQLDDNVIFLGNVNNINAVLKASDVYVHMAMSEGLGAAVIEAMLAKVPVIAANIGGIREIIEDRKSGLLIQPSCEDLAEAIEYLLKQTQVSRKIIDNAFNYATENLNWDVCVKRYIDLYTPADHEPAGQPPAGASPRPVEATA